MGRREEIRRAKAAMRRTARGRRAQAFERHGAEAADRLAEHGLDLLERHLRERGPGAVIGGYQPIGAEIDPLALMTRLFEAEHALALPTVLALPTLGNRPGPLIFRLWRPGDPLECGHHDIPEPRPDSPEQVPDVLLIPLLAFDTRGYRLGYGGGHYDRTLACLRACGSPEPGVLAVGLAFDEQAVDALPVEDHDQRLDLMLTPSGAHEFPARASQHGTDHAIDCSR